MSDRVIHNFGKNISFKPATFAEPENESALLELLADHRGQQVRVLASGHAWSKGIQTRDLLIGLRHFDQVSIDASRGTVWAGAGCQIKRLIGELRKHELTLPSLGLIDEQTIAGATATGTHGSGKQSLSHFIRRVRVAHYDRQTDKPIISLIESGSELQAARCSMGLLGVIVELELQTRPTYRIQEHNRHHDSLESVLAAEEEYPLQQFFLMPWSWQLFAQHRVETGQQRSPGSRLYRLYWHIGIDWGLHLVIVLLARFLRIKSLVRAFFRYVLPLCILRNWRVTDESQKMLTMEHELFRHIEIELFVTRTNLKPALEYLKETIAFFGGIGPDNDPSFPRDAYGVYCHHYPICVRRVLSDDTLISMSSSRESEGNECWYAISLICYNRPGQRAGFERFAEFLAQSFMSRFQGRCHWGKYNPLKLADNQRLYPKLEDFCNVAKRFDQHSRFANDWLRKVLTGD